jgi:large subunit ribosomal protein L21
MVALSPPGVKRHAHRQQNAPFASADDLARMEAVSAGAVLELKPEHGGPAGSGEASSARRGGVRLADSSSSASSSASSSSSSGSSGSDTDELPAGASGPAGSGAGQRAEADAGDAAEGQGAAAAWGLVAGVEGEAGSGRAGGRGSRRRLPGELPRLNEGALPELTEARPALAERTFAVVVVGGSQYKVTAGDIVTAEHVRGAEVGSVLELPQVLAVGSRTRSVLGRPLVPQAFVRAAVEEVTQDAKVIVFKKNRRKRYQKTQGHRRLVTRLRVLSVHTPRALEEY